MGGFAHRARGDRGKVELERQTLRKSEGCALVVDPLVEEHAGEARRSSPRETIALEDHGAGVERRTDLCGGAGGKPLGHRHNKHAAIRLRQEALFGDRPSGGERRGEIEAADEPAIADALWQSAPRSLGFVGSGHAGNVAARRVEKPAKTIEPGITDRTGRRPNGCATKADRVDGEEHRRLHGKRPRGRRLGHRGAPGGRGSSATSLMEPARNRGTRVLSPEKALSRGACSSAEVPTESIDEMQVAVGCREDARVGLGVPAQHRTGSQPGGRRRAGRRCHDVTSSGDLGRAEHL